MNDIEAVLAPYEDKWREVSFRGVPVEEMTLHELRLLAAWAADRYLHNNHVVEDRS